MSRTREDLSALVRSAFEAARASGRQGWQTMRSAVLKNRLLQLTDGKFTESDWGAESWAELLHSELLSDVVELTNDGRETIVRLREAGPPEAAEQIVESSVDIGPSTVVRPDLWRAVMPGRGRGWWSPSRQEVLDAPGDDGRQLPEISDAQMRDWRLEFAQARSLKGQVTAPEWVERADEVLDRPVRSEWYGHLKRHVIDHLQSWFSSEGLTPPLDLATSRAIDRVDTAAEIRRVVMDVVRQMTAEELASLSLPAAAVLRATNR